MIRESFPQSEKQYSMQLHLDAGLLVAMAQGWDYQMPKLRLRAGCGKPLGGDDPYLCQ
jgi:hypothetical protein